MIGLCEHCGLMKRIKLHGVPPKWLCKDCRT